MKRTGYISIRDAESGHRVSGTIRMSTRHIPQGPYCYDENGYCPYRLIDEAKDEQECGYCLWLDKGDWQENGTMLIWDACKECGENDDREEKLPEPSNKA